MGHSVTYVFCHGMPGTIDDAQLLRAANPTASIVALDLLKVSPAASEEGLLSEFDRITADASGKTVHLIGFSIGAMVAIKLAARRPNRVSGLTLVSAAAPLSLGDFLPDTAGRVVFELARNRPWALSLLTRVQGILVRTAPNRLVKGLFAKCGPRERELLRSEHFRDIVIMGMKASFVDHPQSYLTFVKEYVHDWQGDIPDVICPVHLWHGTRDTWAPPSMAQALEKAFAAPVTMTWIEQGEHYSTLNDVVL